MNPSSQTYFFVERDGRHFVDKVRVTALGEWTGDESIILSMQNLMLRRGLNPTNPADVAKLPELVHGSYLWVEARPA